MASMDACSRRPHNGRLHNGRLHNANGHWQTQSRSVEPAHAYTSGRMRTAMAAVDTKERDKRSKGDIRGGDRTLDLERVKLAS